MIDQCSDDHTTDSVVIARQQSDRTHESMNGTASAHEPLPGSCTCGHGFPDLDLRFPH